MSAPRSRSLTASFLALLFLAGAVQAATGTLEGVLKVTAPARKVVQSHDNDSGAFYDEESDSKRSHHLPPEEVVVYLEGVPGDYPAPKQHVQLDQRFLNFTHRVLPILKGTVVDFTNHDRVYHNVFSMSQLNRFDLGRKGRGQKSSVRVNSPEVPLKVYCEIHSDMKSNILVLENPFFVSVQPGEKFRIEGIPAGTYKLVAWHDYWAKVEQTVTITSGGKTAVKVLMDKLRN